VASRNQPAGSSSDEQFFPKGAIAFFASMLLAFAVIWLGLYFMLVQRQLWL
jgi:hypothetical protein